jgi:uncharacterized protein (DUF362 family)/NAD-dependent dihydropyrimidine dehydrogenase PreA subunit
MTRPVVAVAKAGDYGEGTIFSAVSRLFELLGGISQFASPGQSVVLKPNLLMSAAPERAITTHPQVVGALARSFRTAGASVRIVDSPGSGTPWSESSLRKLYDKCAMEPLAGDGIELNFNTALRKVAFPQGKLVRSFELIEAALDCDALVSVAKAKTHTFQIMTGAVKNLFGLIPGFDKPGYHARLKNARNFARMIVDLAQLARPALTVVDAVVGMEGDGPTSGNLRKLGFLMASTDAHALDVVLAHVMSLDPLIVPTVAVARDRGLTTGAFGDIEIVGDAQAVVPVSDFVPPRTVGGAGFGGAGWLVSLLQPVLKKMFVLNPVPVKSLCVGCGACEDACPNLAVTIVDGKAKVKRDQCIRCYCCHEVCPHGAMKLKGSFLYRLFHKVFR